LHFGGASFAIVAIVFIESAMRVLVCPHRKGSHCVAATEPKRAGLSKRRAAHRRHSTSSAARSNTSLFAARMKRARALGMRCLSLSIEDELYSLAATVKDSHAEITTQ
jgi:hypothetical protein